jgi:ankyrin repeat protein
MFPNPQAALPLPLRPDLESYQKLAKELVKACKSEDKNAIGDWAKKWVTMLGKKSDVKFTRQLPVAVHRWIREVEEFARRTLSQSGACRLTDAHSVIARSHGFASWSKFSKHLKGLADKNSNVARFEAAVDAIIKGDLRTLKRLLRSHPDLIRMRSTREHGAMLLHYVSANGVEGYRQKTPQNIVAITELLLNAGAEVDAEADVYGGGATTLGLVATSIHPYLAGVQNPLMQLLLDHGAEIDHTTSAGNQESALEAALDNGRSEAAVYLADRGGRLNLISAAAVGRLDVVKSFFNEGGRLKPNVPRKDLKLALLYACGSGRNDVIEFILNMGIRLNVHGGDGQTPLHCAAIGGHVKTVKLLLKLNPPLEMTNMYGGTVLGQTLWSAAHGGDVRTYTAIIKELIAAGAKVPERHVPVNKPIDNLMRKYGSVPEPTWYWFGENPRDRA